MSPTTVTRLPQGYTLEPRQTRDPRQDERPLLRDREGHILAAVERWSPDVVN